MSTRIYTKVSARLSFGKLQRKVKSPLAILTLYLACQNTKCLYKNCTNNFFNATSESSLTYSLGSIHRTSLSISGTKRIPNFCRATFSSRAPPKVASWSWSLYILPGCRGWPLGCPCSEHPSWSCTWYGVGCGHEQDCCRSRRVATVTSRGKWGG